jgi:hypothetical protein
MRGREPPPPPGGGGACRARRRPAAVTLESLDWTDLPHHTTLHRPCHAMPSCLLGSTPMAAAAAVGAPPARRAGCGQASPARLPVPHRAGHARSPRQFQCAVRQFLRIPGQISVVLLRRPHQISGQWQRSCTPSRGLTGPENTSNPRPRPLIMSLADYKPGILMSGTTHAILADAGVQLPLPGGLPAASVRPSGGCSTTLRAGGAGGPPRSRQRWRIADQWHTQGRARAQGDGRSGGAPLTARPPTQSPPMRSWPGAGVQPPGGRHDALHPRVPCVVPCAQTLMLL